MIPPRAVIAGVGQVVDRPLDVLQAQEFFLLLSSTGLAYRRCELIRVDGCEVGVRFILEKKKKGRPVAAP